MPVDPSTVIAVFKTGQEIYKNFKKDKKDEGNFARYIRQEFETIKKLLGDVLVSMNDLKVFIKDEFVKESLIKLEAIIIVFEQQYQTWWDYPNRNNSIESSSDIFNKLRQYNIEAQKRGYAHYNTIWLAVICELVMHEYHETPNEEMQSVLKDHIQYFENGLNAKLEGSIVNALQTNRKEYEKFKSRFPPLSLKRLNMRGGTERVSAEEKVFFTNRTDSFLEILGDTDEGFRFNGPEYKEFETRTKYKPDTMGNFPVFVATTPKGYQEVNKFPLDYKDVIDKYTNAYTEANTIYKPVIKANETAIENLKFYIESLNIELDRIGN